MNYLYIAFFHTMISLILSVVSGTLFLLTYRQTKNKLYAWCSLLFLLLCVDIFFMHMADILPGFYVYYNSRIESEPLVRSSLIMGYLITYRKIIQYGLNLPLKKGELICIPLLLVLVPATCLFPMTPFYAFLYHTATWAYTFYIFIVAIRTCCHCSFQKKTRSIICFFLAIILFMEILAYVEVLKWINTGKFYLDTVMPDLGQRRFFTDYLGNLEILLGIWYGAYFLKHALREKEAPSLSEESALMFAESSRLTQRETEIFLLVLQEKRNQDIAELLHISLGTVKTHIHNIFAKVSVENRGQLIQKVTEDSSAAKKTAGPQVSQ